jgi:hypothetical protein
MVVEIVASSSPTAIGLETLMAGNVSSNYPFVAVHTQVGFEVNPAPEHINVFLMASGTSEDVQIIQQFGPPGVAKLLLAVGVLGQFCLMTADAGFVADWFKAFVAGTTGSFK